MSVDISRLSAHLPVDEQNAVRAAYRRGAKDPTTAFLLCFFLGIFGAHRFYLGQMRQAWLRLILSPLIVPGLVWEIIDLFRVDDEVYQRNLKVAERLVASAALAVPNATLDAAAVDHLDAAARERSSTSATPADPGSGSAPTRDAADALAQAEAAPDTLVYAANEPISDDAPAASRWSSPLAASPAPEPHNATASDATASDATASDATASDATASDIARTPHAAVNDATAAYPPPVWPIGDFADDPSASGGRAPAWPIANPPDAGAVPQDPTALSTAGGTPLEAVGEAALTGSPEQPAADEAPAAPPDMADAAAPLGTLGALGAGALAGGLGLGAAVLVGSHAHSATGGENEPGPGEAFTLTPAQPHARDLSDSGEVEAVAPLADVGETSPRIPRVRVALPNPPDASIPLAPLAAAPVLFTPSGVTPTAAAMPPPAAVTSAHDLVSGLSLVSLVAHGAGDPTDMLDPGHALDPSARAPLADVLDSANVPVRVTLPESAQAAAPDIFASSGLFGLPADSVEKDNAPREARAVAETSGSPMEVGPGVATLALVPEGESEATVAGNGGEAGDTAATPAGHEPTSETLAELAGFVDAAGIAPSMANHPEAASAAETESAPTSSDAEDTAPDLDQPAAADETTTTATTQPESAAAAPTRRVKRVRVVRRLVVNGQVVQEATAEQVVDADADTTATVANLQQTLGTTDPETLAALSAALPPAPASAGSAHPAETDGEPPAPRANTAAE